MPGTQLSCWVTVTAKDILNTKDLFHPEFVAGQSLSLGTSATSAILNPRAWPKGNKVVCIVLISCLVKHLRAYLTLGMPEPY